MPSRSDEEEMNAPDDVDQSAAMTSAGLGGAGRVKPDGETVTEKETEDVTPSKKRLKWNGRAWITLLKRWVTGKRAEMEEEDMNREMYELALNWMAESKLRKLSGHISKDTDLTLWKQFGEYTKERNTVLVRLFHCPMRHSCGCMAGLRVMEGPGWMQLDRCSEHHPESHDADASKYLTYDQIIAVVDGVTIAQQQSAATLRRNMQMEGHRAQERKFLLI
jgi:hypothetical protein